MVFIINTPPRLRQSWRVISSSTGTNGITKHAFGAPNFNPNPKDDKFLVRIEKVPQKQKEATKNWNPIHFTDCESARSVQTPTRYGSITSPIRNPGSPILLMTAKRHKDIFVTFTLRTYRCIERDITDTPGMTRWNQAAQRNALTSALKGSTQRKSEWYYPWVADMEFLFAWPYPLRVPPPPPHINAPAKHNACKRIAGLQLKHQHNTLYCRLSFAP